MPQARIAVSSLWRAIIPSASSTPPRVAIGSIWVMMSGILNIRYRTTAPGWA